MKKTAIAGLALVLVGALVFGAGYIGTRGDLSVMNGNLGPFRVHLTDDRVETGFSPSSDSSQSGIGGGRDKPVTTPPPHSLNEPEKPARSTADGEERELDGAGIKRIVIKESFADIELRPSDDGQIHVTSEKRDDFYCEISSKDGVLSIERKGGSFWGVNLGSLTRSSLLVLIPAQLSYALYIENSCGDVSVSELTLGNVEIEAALGSVSFEDVQCTGAKLDSDCGSVSVSRVTCVGDLSAQSDLGDVTIEDVSVSLRLEAECSCGSVTVSGAMASDAELESDMGDINVSDLSVGGTAKLDCDCGSISFSNLSAVWAIEIENSMGSIEGTLPGSISDYSIESGTDLGSNNLPNKFHSGSISLKVFADCGSIDIGFFENS